jgi:ABC-type antimicrobial peptide transport system permease subunit
MALAAAGIALGLTGSLVLTRLMATMLFEVSPHDPLTYTIVALVMVAVALLACLIPAGRATRVDPIVALRCQ